MSKRNLFLTSSGLSDDMKKKFFEVIGKMRKMRGYYIFQLPELKQTERERALLFVFMNFHLWVYIMKIYWYIIWN